MVEFALCLPVLATLTFGLVDLSRAYVITERAKTAAREAAFYAASHPGQLHSVSGSDCADPSNAAWRGAHEGSGTFTFTFSPDLTTCNPTSMPANLSAGRPIRVTAHATLTLLTPLVGKIVGGNPLNISSSVCVSIEGAPSTVACP
jgi:hypothetical protein